MKNGRLPHLFVMCLITAFLFVIVACTKTEDNDSGTSAVEPAVNKAGGVYRTPLRSSPVTLDPARVRDWYGESLVHQLFDGLVRFDQYLSVMPALAETWQVEDNGMVYRFKIREGAVFHDHTPVTVGDVVFSLSRLLRVDDAPVVLPHLLKIQGAREYRDRDADRVSGLEPVDSHTLVVRLTEPHIPFLTALGMCYAKIVPEKTVTRMGDEFGRAPLGSGPFRFVSWESDAMIRLDRFPDYYGDSAFVDELRFKIYPGGRDTQILADFQARTLDEMPVFGAARQALTGNEELQWVHRSSLSLFFYGMNVNHPNLRNPDLRKALSIAIDRQEIVSRIYNDQYDIATTVLPPGMPGYSPDNRIDTNNLSLAESLVKKSVKNESASIPTIEIVSAIRSPSSEAELGLVRETWSRLGIPVEIKYITDWAEFETYLKSDSVQIYRYAWFADMPEPDNFLYSLFASGSPANYMRLSNPEVDELFITARKTVGPVERSALYRTIEATVLESYPLIPIFYMSVDRVYQPDVRGITVSALGAHTMTLNRIWLDRTQ